MKSLLTPFFQASGEAVSGATLAAFLGCSRTMVWKRIRLLESYGYSFSAQPYAGYRLLNHPDTLCPDELWHGLATRVLGANVVYAKSIASTNSHAMELAAKGAPHGTLVLTEHQTAGRGRQDRPWLDQAEKNILASLILRPAWPMASASLITLLAGIAVAQALPPEVESKLKWPNDVFLYGKKCAGILTEMRGQQDGVDFIVCGIGLNVHYAPTLGPAKDATCLNAHLPIPMRRAEVLRRVLQGMEELLNDFERQGNVFLIKRWNRRALWLGDPIHFTTPDGVSVRGVFLGIDPQGAARIFTQDKTEKVFYSGEINAAFPKPVQNIPWDANRVGAG
jgi:BirA family biotin operon repressor/biotin-[acetyl-CoA-carboxylase] ligase